MPIDPIPPSRQKNIEKQCQACGSTFFVSRRKDTPQAACSRKCACAIRDQKKRAETHHDPVLKTCLTCSKPFYVVYSQRHAKTCSRACSYEAMRRKVKKQCVICDESFETSTWKDASTCSRICTAYYRKGGRGSYQRDFQKKCAQCGATYSAASGWQANKKFCSGKCRSAYFKEHGSPTAVPVGTRRPDRDGYWRIKAARGLWMPEHIYVAQQMIGRKLLDNEIVHHRNGKKGDNRPDNLQVMVKRRHALLHQKAEILGMSILAQQAALPVMAGEWVHPLEGCEV